METWYSKRPPGACCIQRSNCLYAFRINNNINVGRKKQAEIARKAVFAHFRSYIIHLFFCFWVVGYFLGQNGPEPPPKSKNIIRRVNNCLLGYPFYKVSKKKAGWGIT